MSEASNGRTVDATRFYRLYDVLMETWAEVYAVQTAIEHRRKRNDEAREKLTPRAREALDAALGQLYVPQEVTNAELGGLDSVRNRIWAALRKEGASPQPSALAELTALAEEMDCEDGPAARRASAGIRAAVAKLRGLAGPLAEEAELDERHRRSTMDRIVPVAQKYLRLGREIEKDASVSDLAHTHSKLGIFLGELLGETTWRAAKLATPDTEEQS